MSDKIQVRKAVLEDWEVIARFNTAMAMETEKKELPLPVISAGVRAVFRNPGHGFYAVAEMDKNIVGCLMVTPEWSDWRNGVFWWIQSVYVRPEFRQQGVYRALYEFVKNAAPENPEVCGFRLYVEKENLRAQKTYRVLGMEETDYRLYEESVRK
ncbi:MAG: N-acetyltransferase [Desulfobacteraceae bacterium]|nr:MAG: N-acetyltransferase [Desulfobacteraceae bacterium]